MKKANHGCALLLAVPIVFIVILFFNNIVSEDIVKNDHDLKYHEYEEEFYGKDMYAELFGGISNQDKETLQPVIELVEQAFSFIGTEKQAKKRYGVLSRYSLTHSRGYSEVHRFSVPAAKLNISNRKGYMWIYYTRKGFDENGKEIMGAGDITSRITLELNNGKWQPKDILECP